MTSRFLPHFALSLASIAFVLAGRAADAITNSLGMKLVPVAAGEFVNTIVQSSPVPEPPVATTSSTSGPPP